MPRPRRSSDRAATAELEVDRLTRRAAQRAHLIESAITVIQREGPGASMDQMAAQAGVTKPILYRHFSDRAGLVAAIAEFAFSQVSMALEAALHANATPRELVASTIDTYLVFIESDPDVYRFLVQPSISEAGVSINDYIWRTSRQVAVVLGEALRAAGVDSGPAEVWAFGIVGMVHSSGDWWLERGTMPRARLTEYLTSLVCDGLPDLSSLGSAGAWLPQPTGTHSELSTVITEQSEQSEQSTTTDSEQPADGEAKVLPIAAAEARRSS
ncbi:MAG TPA: TetR/AcrR family transcriptional regulator [Acidimicrobiales bacterium]|nr:TetR/AcrR family transcriptional regulator [Acidimicrobiales bacterium]